MLRVGLVVAGLVASARLASAQPGREVEAESHLAIAQTHYRAGRYEQAIAELRIAHAADPHPQYLWAIAQAQRFSGDCAHAIESYGAYLLTGPKPSATKLTQSLIDECQATLAAKAAAAPATATPTTTASTPAPPPPPSEPLIIREVQRVHTRELYIPWYRDWQGDLLAGAGLLTLAGGAVAFSVASTHDDNATTATSYAQIDREVNQRDRAEAVGTVMLVGGGALVVGALIRYALRPKRVHTEVLVEPAAAGGATVGLRWSSW